MYHSLFIHSSPKGYPGCFQVVAILNTALVNVPVQVLVWACVFSSSGEVSGSTVAGSYDKNMFVCFFKKPSNCLPKWLHHFSFPPAMMIPLLHIPPAFGAVTVLEFGHSNSV